MLNVDADLAFRATLPAAATASTRGRLARPDGKGARRKPAEISGRVRARGQVVTVQVSELPSLAPLVAFTVTRGARGFAEQLTRHGLTVRVVGLDDRVVMEVGDRVRAPRWQRLLTGTRAIRIRSVRACLRSIRGPRLLEVALPARR